MTASTTITRFAQTTLLCSSVFVANGVWSKDCVEGAGSANALKMSALGAEQHSVTVGTQPGALSGAELHALLHDPTLNKGDDLGDYAENFQATF
jgi:hypothetical protein